MESLLTKRYSSATLFIAAAAGAVAAVAYMRVQRSASMEEQRKSRRDQRSVLREEVYYVPLPDKVVRMLNAARLCTLATAGPHLSLMNFSYYRPDEVIILTTRRNTKKYRQIETSEEVSILINDFPLLRSNENDEMPGGRTGSITLNGIATILADKDALSLKYRAYHLENNPGYRQFIDGQEDIAVIKVSFESASMCDFSDKVDYWQRGT